VREALFNTLAARLDLTGMAVLDLYAGSGALGIEALSRGAARALFVESSLRNAEVIERNVASLGLAGATVVARQVASVLAAGGNPVDLILADPPYDMSVDEVNAMLGALAFAGWTAAGTVVAVERRATTPPLTWPDRFQTWPPRRYGDTRLEIAEFR
jgi:16S rRNA (guanine(966)-N(2))-methyltransferase RsmD